MESKEHITCSKKILIASYIIGIVLTIVTVVGSFLGYDTMALSAVTGIAYAEISVSNAFYFSKAKHENTLKIAIGCVEKSHDKTADIAAIISALGGIL